MFCRPSFFFDRFEIYEKTRAVERSLRTVGTGCGNGIVRLIARTQCDDLSLLNRVCGRVTRYDLWQFHKRAFLDQVPDCGNAQRTGHGLSRANAYFREREKFTTAFTNKNRLEHILLTLKCKQNGN